MFFDFDLELASGLGGERLGNGRLIHLNWKMFKNTLYLVFEELGFEMNY
jgi:hypothetical protein